LLFDAILFEDVANEMLIGGIADALVDALANGVDPTVVSPAAKSVDAAQYVRNFALH
jgi:hypothetical protein